MLLVFRLFCLAAVVDGCWGFGFFREKERKAVQQVVFYLCLAESYVKGLCLHYNCCASIMYTGGLYQIFKLCFSILFSHLRHVNL